jgi:hypothetical protein
MFVVGAMPDVGHVFERLKNGPDTHSRPAAAIDPGRRRENGPRGVQKKTPRSAYNSAAETAIAVSANSPDSPDAFMAMGARWKLGELDPSATREACPERLTQWVQPMLVQLLSLNGVIASPRVDFYSGADNARSQWPKMFIKKALETGKGRIDGTLSGSLLPN